MILVADSGSSKTNWLLDTPGAEPAEFLTDGLNPYFLSEKEMVKKMQDQLQGGFRQQSHRLGIAIGSDVSR